MIRAKDKPIDFNYIMRQDGGAWQILDILLDGTISQLAARRSEFTSIIGREGVDGLVVALEKKILELARS
jgi:phospholipid transport system substrate-binding protein